MNRNRVSLRALSLGAIIVGCATLIAFSPLSFGEESGAAEHEHSAPASTQDSRALHHAMEAMNHDLARLTRMVKDPAKKEAALELIQDLEQHTLAAKGMTPRGAATRPAAERPEYLSRYRRELREVLAAELDLEQQVADGQTDKAVASIKQLRHLEQVGHSEFRPHRRHD